jgi:hypothetical protein
MENIDNVATRAADITTGAAAEAADVVTDPSTEARRLERRGGPINRRLAHRAEGWARDTASTARKTAREVVDGTIPERVANSGLRIVKSRARRRDLVGDAAYRTLELVHGGLGSAARALNRLEEATQPPARPTTRRSATSGGPRPAASRTTTGKAGPRRTA